ncbi:orotidine-5'-phosphate decarboxylase [Thioalbus denitrificans]|uniref:Orotidine 5'-phosphate decarboxylase n=1 Tax=Thioalbus denitrificans TaxID=547122 RepID=A0A369CDF3_9GAMM|nr:orotidine-5'-phosphate decarboxylase [Thioalbus denitrificans]RCX30647.1 orotidine-5'-phosphate decarboxylase [Thioalbus denitrificans]
MQNTNDPRVIVALDYPSADAALALVERLDPARCRVKVGKELFTRAGPELVRRLVDGGFDVFLDLKYHDIPNTVAGACAAAADLGVWMVNVHALGGRAMMEAAREALEAGGRRPLLIAVTVLTSHSEADLAEIGLAGSPMENVQRLAALAQGSGLDGVVCSPREVATLRAAHGEGFRLVTPGIRPSGAALGDQKRVMTPGDAIRSGSDYLVIGRPVTGADDPMGVLLAVEAEIGAVLAG